jgi:hypothetical protein
MDAWVEQRRRLLRLEQDEERRQLAEKLQHLSPQACQEYGISLLGLDIEESWTALFGRTTLLIKRLDKAPFPTHSFRVGDEATLYSPKLRHTEQADSSSCTGVISRVSYSSIELVCDSLDATEFSSPLRLDMSSSEATHKKLNDALIGLHDRVETPAWSLIRLIFENAPLTEPTAVHITPINAGLNESQVIKHALSKTTSYDALGWCRRKCIKLPALGSSARSTRNGENDCNYRADITISSS